MLSIMIVISIIVCDQVTKNIVINNIGIGNAYEIIPNFFYISHYKNTGVAWSLLSNQLHIVIPLTFIIIVAMSYYLFKVASCPLIKTSFSFILGGAIGNLIDRIVKGSVTDFFEFHFGSYIFPVFNMADIFVVAGELILLYYIIFVIEQNNNEP